MSDKINSYKINSSKINPATLALIIKALESGQKYYIHPETLGKRNMEALKKIEGFKAEPYRTEDGKDSGFLVLTIEKGEI